MNNIAIVKKANILIVDDMPENLKLLSDLMADQGYVLRLTTNGAHALAAAQALPPDLILLDILMPDMDGFEVCRQLKANEKTKDIPVIFLTALSDSENVVAGFELGAADYIIKPFKSVEVLARVKTHLDLHFSKQIIAEKNQKQNELIHILCHDLLNSIFAINAILAAKKATTNDILSSFDATIEKSAQNATEIIELVRKLSSLENGKFAIQLASANLAKLISQAVAMVEQKLAKKNIQLIQKVADDILVNVDSVSFINSVMLNLFTNAIKFSFSGTKIIIEAEQTKKAVILSVEDFGIGMSPALCNDLFEINKQTSRPGTHGESGTGFGMPLMKEFIQVYGGTIAVVSQEKTPYSENHGTKVIITLPRVADTTLGKVSKALPINQETVQSQLDTDIVV